MQIKFTFLGTGTSVGVPMLLSDHPIKESKDPRDQRLRCSVLLQSESTDLLIDCGPDFRAQLLKHSPEKLDAILFTHEHSDHIAGLDDIRPYCFRQGPIPIYGLKRVIQSLEQRYAYIFKTENRYPGAASVDVHEIDETKEMTLGDLQVQPIAVNHGNLPILGYRIENIAYLTDVKTLPDHEFNKLKNLEVLVLSCLREQPPHPTHLNLEEALGLIVKIGAKKTYLTHISHLFGKQEDFEKLLPPNVFAAYDNLVLELKS